MLFRAATKGGPTRSPIFPCSVVPLAKMRVRFLHVPSMRSFLVAPVSCMSAQLTGISDAGMPVKPLADGLAMQLQV